MTASVKSDTTAGSGGEDDGEPTTTAHGGLAAVMAKILAKKVPSQKSVILAKAKTERELMQKKRKLNDNSDSEDKEEVKTASKLTEKKSLSITQEALLKASFCCILSRLDCVLVSLNVKLQLFRNIC